MNRVFYILISLLLLFGTVGCSKENAELPAETVIEIDETEILKAELEKLAPYRDLITCLEHGDYATAAQMIEALRLERYGEEIAEGTVQEIKINADNWGEFFEVQEITQWQQDDMGQTLGFVTHVCIALRDEWKSCVISDNTQVEFAWKAVCSVKNCTVDLDNRIVSMENEFKSNTTTFGEAEVMTGTVSYSGQRIGEIWSGNTYVAGKIGEIVLIGEYHLSGELKPVCYDYDKVEITGVQGILVLNNVGGTDGE